MLKAVIFDADGTLLDTMGMWKQLDIDFLSGVGIEVDESYTEVVNKMTLAEGVHYTKERFGLSMTEEEILQTILDMAHVFYRESAELKPFVREFLEALSARNIPMAVATSSQRDFIEPALQRTRADHYFRDIFSCADIGINKTQPDIFYLAAKALNAEPSKAWVVEDSFHAVQTAKKAGFSVLAVYDASNEGFLAETVKAADLYLPQLDAERFLEQALLSGKKDLHLHTSRRISL